jgi:hypothetical protein
MALPLGEAGINEIPNESVALTAMQSSMGETTGLYVSPGRQSPLMRRAVHRWGRISTDPEITEYRRRWSCPRAQCDLQLL